MLLRPTLLTLLALLAQPTQAADRRDAPLVTRPVLADVPTKKSSLPAQLPPVEESETSTDDGTADTVNPKRIEQERRTARESRTQQRHEAEEQRAEQRRQRHAQRTAQEQAEQEEADELREKRRAQRNERLQREREEQAQRRQARHAARTAGQQTNDAVEPTSTPPRKTMPESASKAPKLPLRSAPSQTQDDEE